MARDSVRSGARSRQVSREQRREARRANVRELRIISPEPVLVKVLRARKPILLSETGYEWLLAWVEDVGRVLRSRESMVYNIAMTVNYLAFVAIAGILEAFGAKTLAKFLRRG